MPLPVLTILILPPPVDLSVAFSSFIRRDCTLYNAGRCILYSNRIQDSSG